MNKLRSLVRDRRGANMVEYILLVGVVALISIAAFKAFQAKIWDRTQKQGETVGHINAGSGELERPFLICGSLRRDVVRAVSFLCPRARALWCWG